MLRINKVQARKRFDNGEQLLVLPCRLHVNNIYHRPTELKKSDTIKNFNDFVNEYEYYNCNTETGKYIAYYVKEQI